MTTMSETPSIERLPASAGSLVVAIDIDGTWTLNPRLFFQIAGMFTLAGWEVIIVTGSQQPKEKLERLSLQYYHVIVSGSLLKEEAARRAGYKVDVWIDDMPGMIQNCRIIADNLDSENVGMNDRP